jgi:hypothetical protein
MPEALPAVTAAGLVEGRAQPGQRFDRGACALMYSSVSNTTASPLRLRNLNRHDLVLEAAGLLRRLGLLLRLAQRERVLLLAGDAVTSWPRSRP